MYGIDTTPPLDEAEREIFAKIVNDLRKLNLDSQRHILQKIQDNVTGSSEPRYKSWPMFVPMGLQP
jgi:hypothetical protein